MEDVIALYRKEMPELANAAYMRKAMDYGLIGVFHGDELEMCIRDRALKKNFDRNGNRK